LVFFSILAIRPRLSVVHIRSVNHASPRRHKGFQTASYDSMRRLKPDLAYANETSVNIGRNSTVVRHREFDVAADFKFGIGKIIYTGFNFDKNVGTLKFGEGFCGCFCRRLSCLGAIGSRTGRFAGICRAGFDEIKLPPKKGDLDSGNPDESKRKSRDGLVRRRSPNGFLYLLIAFFVVVVLATRWILGGSNSEET